MLTIGTLVLPGFVGNVSMHFPENGVGSLDYAENGTGLLLELARSNHGSSHVAMQVCSSQHAAGNKKACSRGEESTGCDDSESGYHSSNGSSQGSSARMDDSEWCSAEGGKKRGMSPLSLKALEQVVMQVLESVRASGYGEEVCREFRNHFARLPSRYLVVVSLSFPSLLVFSSSF